ncbi:MAG: hypothetical protein U9Q15_00785 [Patescibacteria group bacterium]|nr:hypothetical protein [Patescibacteria group bacterium]
MTISEKHANFWMHDGQHDSSGFRELVDMVKKDIKNKFGIELELEVEVV